MTFASVLWLPQSSPEKYNRSKKLLSLRSTRLKLLISHRVNSLSNVLQNVKTVLSQEGLTDQQQMALQPILEGCEAVLSELSNKKVIDDSRSSANSSRNGLLAKLLRTYKRVKWDPDDIKDLRSRIALHVGCLNTFNGSFNRYIDPIKRIRVA